MNMRVDQIHENVSKMCESRVWSPVMTEYYIREVHDKLCSLKVTLEEARQVAIAFKDASMDAEMVRNIIMFLALADRKLFLNDMCGVEWCIGQIRKCLGPVPLKPLVPC